MSFMGYRRPDGGVGVRNHVLVISSVSCANGVVNAIARAVDEVRVVTHVPVTAKPCKHSCAFKEFMQQEKAGEIDCNLCYQVEIKEGIVECAQSHIFPIVDHIPRMLPDAFSGLDGFLKEYKDNLPVDEIKKKIEGKETRKFTSIQKNTRESFGYEWLRYDVDLEEEDLEVFLEDSQISEKEFGGKVILDAGCGMGRYTRIAGKMGGEIIGIDLSQSTVKAYQMTRDNTSVHIIQGDIIKLPFREKQFDVIYSMGVLHHTPDTRRSVVSLTKYLRKGGLISIWVYGTAGKYRYFKTNPLRKDRQGYAKNNMSKRLHWFIVYVREILSKTVRLVTTRMYVPLLYLLCYPLAAIGKVPFLKYLTASVHKNWKVRLLENFDWFSPQYQSHHTKEEVASWFKEAKLDDISMLKHGFIPKVGVRGKLK
jgi:SAM-dependent methyltransferase/uncharacterized protein YbaR (Trm112 family)